MKLKVEMFGKDVVFTDNCTTIFNSYDLSNKSIKKIVDRIVDYRYLNNLQVTRSKSSYIKEIKAHNRLYKMGLYIDHTTDTDLEEPISKKHELAYSILGI